MDESCSPDLVRTILTEDLAPTNTAVESTRSRDLCLRVDRRA